MQPASEEDQIENAQHLATMDIDAAERPLFLENVPDGRVEDDDLMGDNRPLSVLDQGW